MFVDERLKREVCEDVTIINDEGLIRDEIGDVRDATRCLQQKGLVAEGDGCPAVSLIRKGEVIAFRQMVRVHDELTEPGGEKMIEGIRDERPVEDRNQGLRELVSEGSEAGAQSGTQNKSLVHGNDLRSDDSACKHEAADAMSLRTIHRPHSMNHHERSIIAAQGYLELGMFREVWRELHTLPTEMLGRSDVLEILALSLMGEERWAEALVVAERLREEAPGEAGGFIHSGYCLHEMGRTEEALHVLLNGPDSLRTKSVFFYNVACYQARLGLFAEAMEMLRKSFEMDASLRKSARRDPDLVALQSKI